MNRKKEESLHKPLPIQKCASSTPSISHYKFSQEGSSFQIPDEDSPLGYSFKPPSYSDHNSFIPFQQREISNCLPEYSMICSSHLQYEDYEEHYCSEPPLWYYNEFRHPSLHRSSLPDYRNYPDSQTMPMLPVGDSFNFARDTRKQQMLTQSPNFSLFNVYNDPHRYSQRFNRALNDHNVGDHCFHSPQFHM